MFAKSSCIKTKVPRKIPEGKVKIKVTVQANFYLRVHVVRSNNCFIIFERLFRSMELKMYFYKSYIYLKLLDLTTSRLCTCVYIAYVNFKKKKKK